MTLSVEVLTAGAPCTSCTATDRDGRWQRRRAEAWEAVMGAGRVQGLAIQAGVEWSWK
jgi:hypothetical protein